MRMSVDYISIEESSLSSASVSTTEKESTPWEGYNLMLPQIFEDIHNYALSPSLFGFLLRLWYDVADSHLFSNSPLYYSENLKVKLWEIKRVVICFNVLSYW